VGPRKTRNEEQSQNYRRFLKKDQAEKDIGKKAWETCRNAPNQGRGELTGSHSAANEGDRAPVLSRKKGKKRATGKGGKLPGRGLIQNNAKKEEKVQQLIAA